MVKYLKSKILCLALVAMSSVTVAQVSENTCDSWAPNSRYMISAAGDEVVDLETNLVWKRCSEGQQWNGESCMGTISKLSYDDAVVSFPYHAYQWRLPTFLELSSLRTGEFKKGGCSQPAINLSVFPDDDPAVRRYLSATRVASYVRAVDFNSGIIFNSGATLKVRLVKNQN